MKDSIKTLEELKDISKSTIFTPKTTKGEIQCKKVIGWLCTYIPEEIIYAAGFFPTRVMGSNATDVAESEAYLYSNTCSLARCCLELGLKGDYDYLVGLVAGTTCDHIRRLYEVWDRYLDVPFSHLLVIPHKLTENSHRFFRLEVKKFYDRLEEFSGKEITEESLRRAIGTYNKTRTLLKTLYDLRKEEFPPISGAEIQDILTAGTMIPKDKYNHLLTTLIKDISNRKERHEGKVRFLISGAVLDTSQYIKEIEDLGGLVVADELCTGSSYFWDLVDEVEQPLDALARRYLEHAPCARIRPSNERFEHLLNLVETFRVDGVIALKIKFCDLYGYDNVYFKQRLEQRGVPVLELEREYKDSGSGQMRTRVQAFIEMLEA